MLASSVTSISTAATPPLGGPAQHHYGYSNGNLTEGLDGGKVLRNGLIGDAAGGLLGGFSLLAKTSLPLLGKVTGLSGIARLAGIGGAVGIASAVLPTIWPKLNQYPLAKAA